jgi:hypothetical protein
MKGLAGNKPACSILDDGVLLIRLNEITLTQDLEGRKERFS